MLQSLDIDYLIYVSVTLIMCAALHYETEYLFTSFKIKYLFTVLHLSLYFSLDYSGVQI